MPLNLKVRFKDLLWSRLQCIWSRQARTTTATATAAAKQQKYQNNKQICSNINYSAKHSLLTVRRNVYTEFSFIWVVVSMVLYQGRITLCKAFTITKDHTISQKCITFDWRRIGLIHLCHRYRSVLCSSHVSSNRKVESKGIANQPMVHCRRFHHIIIP